MRSKKRLLFYRGGVSRLLEMTTCFYTKALDRHAKNVQVHLFCAGRCGAVEPVQSWKVFANPHLEPFFASTEALRDVMGKRGMWHVSGGEPSCTTAGELGPWTGILDRPWRTCQMVAM